MDTNLNLNNPAAMQQKEVNIINGKGENEEEERINNSAGDVQSAAEGNGETGQTVTGHERPDNTDEGRFTEGTDAPSTTSEPGRGVQRYAGSPKEDEGRSSERAQESTEGPGVVKARPAHRPSELERRPELKDKIVSYLMGGNFIETACDLVGIHPSTFHQWMQRGEGTHPDRTQAPIFVDFVEAVKRAMSFAEATRVKRIEDAGKGGGIAGVKKNYTTVSGPDGKPMQVLASEEITYTRPQWQADAWFLERSKPARWGRKLDITAKLAGKTNEELEQLILEGELVGADDTDIEEAEQEEG